MPWPRRIRPRRRKGRPRWRAWLLLCLPPLLLLWLAILAEKNLGPIVFQIAEVRARAWATGIIAGVINEQIIPGLSYEKLIHIECDNSGRVAYMQPDTLEINRVMAAAVSAIQTELAETKQFKITVPLNQALGTELFINIGPRIPAYVSAVGSVTASVVEEFSEAGINQTRHVIYLEIRSQMHIVVPWVRTTREVSTRLPLAQAIVVGGVPNTYVRIGP